jgi:hydrogenase expression/formation protein HypE
VPDGVDLSTAYARPGDAVLVNGTIGDHGLAILSRREGIDFGSTLKSDTAPLSNLTVGLLERFSGIRCMRDATRGGLGAVLNEIASDSGVCAHVEEEAIPVKEEVIRGCELMGYEPLHIANEGKFVTVVSKDQSGAVLKEMKKHPLGREAAVIGEIEADPPGRVVMRTAIGGERVVDFPYGDILPRIC